LLGLALGFSPTEMGLQRHIVSTEAINKAVMESNPV
jgi:heterodisulfide reductase subunit B